MPKKGGSIKTWSAKMKSRHIKFCNQNHAAMLIVLREDFHVVRSALESFNSFENDIMKLSVNETKLAGLWDTNCATIQQVLISKFAFQPEKLPGFRETGPRPLRTLPSLGHVNWTNKLHPARLIRLGHVVDKSLKRMMVKAWENTVLAKGNKPVFFWKILTGKKTNNVFIEK